jgi:hypothetical protein
VARLPAVRSQPVVPVATCLTPRNTRVCPGVITKAFRSYRHQTFSCKKCFRDHGLNRAFKAGVDVVSGARLTRVTADARPRRPAPVRACARADRLGSLPNRSHVTASGGCHDLPRCCGLTRFLLLSAGARRWGKQGGPAGCRRDTAGRPGAAGTPRAGRVPQGHRGPGGCRRSGRVPPGCRPGGARLRLDQLRVASFSKLLSERILLEYSLGYERSADVAWPA